MVDEIENSDLDAIKAELETVAFNNFANVMTYLAKYYGDHFHDDLEINREFLKVLTGMVGRTIAHFPDEQRESVMEMASKNIAYYQDMEELELSIANDRQEKTANKAVSNNDDLSTIMPMGNC